MALRLRINTSSTIPIRVKGILPETTDGLAAEDVARLEIQWGNERIELGQCFDVSRDDQSDSMVWEGDLSAVHWLGTGMTAGVIRVDGHVGRHLGSAMRGGKIHVAGNVSDYAGCESQGGTIVIDGRAGDWLGAAYPGSKSGKNGGLILVTGDAGHAAGSAMRRGTIVVGGNCGRLAGWNMLAGTIWIGESVGQMLGKGMVRGSVILPRGANAALHRRQLPPTFTASGIHSPLFLKPLQRWLEQEARATAATDRFQSEWKDWAGQRFQLFCGDHLRGGRGEVWIAND